MANKSNYFPRRSSHFKNYKVILSGRGSLKWKEEDQYGEDFFVDFTNPDFVKLAEAMHCIGYRITKTEDFLPTLEKAFAQDAPVIIDVPVDYDENSKLSAELKAFAQHLQNQQ